MALNTTPIETKDWTWDLNFTYTKNTSKIVELHENVANYITLVGDAAYGNYRIASVAEVGGEYGLLKSDATPNYDEKPVCLFWNWLLITAVILCTIHVLEKWKL